MVVGSYSSILNFVQVYENVAFYLLRKIIWKSKWIYHLNKKLKNTKEQGEIQINKSDTPNTVQNAISKVLSNDWNPNSHHYWQTAKLFWSDCQPLHYYFIEKGI